MTKEFVKELLKLMEKYDVVSLGVDYDDCSDTHGMIAEEFVIDFKGGKSVSLNFGYGVDKYDLECYLKSN